MDTDRLQRLIMWVIAVTVVGGTILALRYVRGYRPAAGLVFPGTTDMPANIALSFDNVRSVGRKGNKRAWTLTAGKVQTDRDHTTLNFSDHIIATLLDNGTPRAIISAPQATFDANARLLVAAGRIECTVFPKIGDSRGIKKASSNLVMEAQEVVWNVGTHTVVCRGPVHATLDGDDLSGNDLSVDLDTRDMAMNQFHATLMLDDSSANSVSDTLQGLTP
jgi:hypothetical protein